MGCINITEVSNEYFAMSENLPTIAEELFWSIILACPKGGTILELGSGATTALLAEHRNIYSVEDNPEWIGKYNAREKYIYAPQTEDGWYDPQALRGLPQYQVLFVDGPAEDSRMEGFIRHMDLFDKRAHWFFDDIAHGAFEDGLAEVQRKRQKTMIRFDKCYKQYGAILGD